MALTPCPEASVAQLGTLTDGKSGIKITFIGSRNHFIALYPLSVRFKKQNQKLVFCKTLLVRQTVQIV